MPTSRVTPKRAPVCPGRNSRFTVRHNATQGNAWWVYYEPQGAPPIPADQPHPELVSLVNFLKESEGTSPGGSFSITEHSQVVARMMPTGGYSHQNAIHVVGIHGGNVMSYHQSITFDGGSLNPAATPDVGDPWPGPRCGTTYTFSAPEGRRPPSHNLDEIRIEVDGSNVQLSSQLAGAPYPPASGPLASFLTTLRLHLPSGGRFRVNEHGRAFTAEGNIFVGTVPLTHWFQPISALD
jgi:hypothetical protein